MFLFDETESSSISEKSLVPGIRVLQGPMVLLDPSRMLWGMNADMVRHVFDHQAPLTRPLKAVGAACSATITLVWYVNIAKKSMEIHENQLKSMKITKKQ